LTGDLRHAPPDDPEDADPGLARERTALAWTRSSLAFAAVGIAIVKARPAVGIPILAFGLVVWLLGRLGRAQDAQARARRALLMTVGISTLAAATLVITLVGSGASGIRLR
jgi:uncharacterized membrane protein YidH (DUF202 family)